MLRKGLYLLIVVLMAIVYLWENRSKIFIAVNVVKNDSIPAQPGYASLKTFLMNPVHIKIEQPNAQFPIDRYFH
jgi:hypothetical protein